MRRVGGGCGGCEGGAAGEGGQVKGRHVVKYFDAQKRQMVSVCLNGHLPGCEALQLLRNMIQ